MRAGLIQGASLVLMLGGHSHAEGFVGTRPAAKPPTLAEHRVEIPERGAVVGYMLSVATNHFSFLPPPGWKVSCRPGGTSIVMMPADFGASMTIELLAVARSESNSSDLAVTLLAARFAEATVRESFAVRTGVGEGAAFDVHRTGAQNTRITSRVVYVPYNEGVIEFTLTAPAAKFRQWTASFANVVNSFHIPSRSR